TIEHVLARLPRAPPDKPDARDLAGRERRSAHQHRGGAKQQQRPAADAAAPRNPLCPNRHRGLPGRDSFLIFLWESVRTTAANVNRPLHTPFRTLGPLLLFYFFFGDNW